MTRVSKATGISPEKLTVHSNKDGSEYVLYRIDKVTEEERAVLEQKEAKALRGDVNLDGVLTEEDAGLINAYEMGDIDFTELQLEIADINGDDFVDSVDASLITEILEGVTSYLGGNLIF